MPEETKRQGPEGHGEGTLLGLRTHRSWSTGQERPLSPTWARPPYLGAVLDVVAFVKAQVAQVVGWGPLARLAALRREGQVGEVLGEGAEAICDVVEGAVR